MKPTLFTYRKREHNMSYIHRTRTQLHYLIFFNAGDHEENVPELVQPSNYVYKRFKQLDMLIKILAYLFRNSI